MIEKDFTATDFLSDPYFRKWVLRPDTQNALYWEHWLKTHPYQQQEMEWARQLLTSLQQYPHTLAEEKVNKLWAVIEAGTAGTQQAPGSLSI